MEDTYHSPNPPSGRRAHALEAGPVDLALHGGQASEYTEHSGGKNRQAGQDPCGEDRKNGGGVGQEMPARVSVQGGTAGHLPHRPAEQDKAQEPALPGDWGSCGSSWALSAQRQQLCFQPCPCVRTERGLPILFLQGWMAAFARLWSAAHCHLVEAHCHLVVILTPDPVLPTNVLNSSEGRF